MSIIQTIRDKGARISVILIALALIGFILTDYFSSKTRGMFRGGSGDLVGRVNGKGIVFQDFNRKVDLAQDNFKKQGYPSNGQTTQMAIDNTWEQEVSRVLLDAEFDKLGIAISNKELGDILYGANAPADLKQQFTDPKTGIFNAVQAKQQIDQILKKGTPEQKANFNEYINALIQQRKTEKFLAAVNNSSNVPRWFIEKQNGDNSQMAKISFVKEVYASISDSAVKIDDKDIADYINKHKDQFKQAETRTINYITFSAAPSGADSLDAVNKLLALKATLDTTTNLEQFFLSEGVDASFNYDGYKSAKTVQSSMKDSIFKIPVGSIYGPYLDGGNVVLAKLQGVRTMPDTVKVRHILIATTDRDPQTGQSYEKRDSAKAYKLADSIRTAIANGSNFDSLCVKLSEDPGSKDKGGVYEIFSGQMVGPFNDFAFLNSVGSKGIVKTQFGYHYIEIISQKGSGMGYKIAYLPKEILASQETINNAVNQANMFAGDCKDQKSFDANYEKNLKSKGVNKASATVGPRDGQITGLGFARQFVKDIYAASLGEVLKPEKVDMNGYEVEVVAVVTEILKEGTQSVAKARAGVEAVLRNSKKAEMLKQKIGKITNLEAAAAILGGKNIETVDSLRMNGKSVNNALGYEPKVSGAAFNPNNKGKVVGEALEGVNGVYVVRVDDVITTPMTFDLAATRKQLIDQRKQASNPIDGLKKAATIKDYRSEKY
jgi:peptidyl-prolyl cis-trans isomerase D